MHPCFLLENLQWLVSFQCDAFKGKGSVEMKHPVKTPDENPAAKPEYITYHDGRYA